MRGSWVFTAGLVLKSVLLCGVLAFLVVGGARNLGEAAFLVGLALFLVGKAAFFWYARRRIDQVPKLSRFLTEREWRVLAAISFAGASAFLVAAVGGHETLWSWVGVLAAGAAGWTYFVISLKRQVA